MNLSATPAHLPSTPGQTIGPFFHEGVSFPDSNEIVSATGTGTRRLHGIVSDGDGSPIPDALVELWQADPDGRVSQETGSLRRGSGSFTGFGRTATSPEGVYEFFTLQPGATDPQTPAFFAVTVFARGLLDRLFTRAYLPAEQQANAGVLTSDALLARLPPERRQTLICVPDDQGWRFDLTLQGENETVFLRYPQ